MNRCALLDRSRQSSPGTTNLKAILFSSLQTSSWRPTSPRDMSFFSPGVIVEPVRLLRPPTLGGQASSGAVDFLDQEGANGGLDEKTFLCFFFVFVSALVASSMLPCLFFTFLCFFF
ncbi:hypothetical protein K431DRAFT_53088 [Polychaeton citri CBS 116435]|uniref:Transmembrane protein n=1 Tax=Polychaeton citri CBS 116435 TaxID=1314669 RepID=A0A9P4UV44_9PEZI|nr:hypothetical protein K431DRAFT_53088 [Polychaeton citri CBS 116435]